MSPPLSHTLPVYLRIGLLSFGGPAGQIALMQEECVERRGWITPTQFGHGLSIAMVLPGPEAQQLATWIGWRLGGMRGGLAAGLAFILPGAALMIALAAIAAHWGEVPPVAAIFTGIQPAVLLIVARALMKIAGKSLSGPADYTLALAAFLGLWALGLPFPLIIAAAALIGLLRRGGATPEPPRTAQARWSLAPLFLCAVLVAAVWLATRTALGPDPFDGLARLFTTAAFVSFGGAYALLPYVAEHAVETEGWLSAAQMLNGLAIAEGDTGSADPGQYLCGLFRRGGNRAGRADRDARDLLHLRPQLRDDPDAGPPCGGGPAPRLDPPRAGRRLGRGGRGWSRT